MKASCRLFFESPAIESYTSRTSSISIKNPNALEKWTELIFGISLDAVIIGDFSMTLIRNVHHVEMSKRAPR